MYSLAKVTMQNMWNYGYTLNEKLQAKNGNEWYNIVVTPNGATSEEDRQFGLQLYKMYRNSLNEVNIDMDDNSAETSSGPAVNTDAVEF